MPSFKFGAAPTVSIGLPVFNGEDFLADALNSILAQSFEDFELIIGDNASTDRTPEICADYAERDRRITVIRHPRNLGAAKNYNHVFHCASGEFFKWAAHDDLLGPGFLATCLAGFADAPEPPVLVYPNFEFIDATGRLLTPESPFVHTTATTVAGRLRDTLRGLGLVTSVFGLFRRETLARTQLIGSFESSDYALLVECALLGPILRLDGPVEFRRRLHDKTSRQANTTTEDVMRWFDPDAVVDPNPLRRLRREYLKSVFNLGGLTKWDRLMATATLVRDDLKRAR